MSSEDTSPDVSVLVPLDDPRGDVVEHLRTWTRAQTLERRRLQVVAIADGRHPELVHAVKDALGWARETVSADGGLPATLIVDASGDFHAAFGIPVNDGIGGQEVRYALGTAGGWSVEIVEPYGRPMQLALELQVVGRIGEDHVDRRRRQALQDRNAVSDDDLVGRRQPPVRPVSSPHGRENESGGVRRQ